MQKRLTDYAIPLILVILSLLGGGKLTFQFSILAIVVISIIGLILLSKNKLPPYLIYSSVGNFSPTTSI